MLDDPKNFVITDGQKYLTRNKKTNLQEITTNICDARVYDSYIKANQVMTTMRKTLRITDWQVKTIEDNTNKEVVRIENNDIDYDFVNTLQSIEKFSKQLLEQKSQLENKLTNVEKEIIDIEHAAEFYNLDAAKGYKIYKMLHEARIERRKCKDGLTKISYVLDGNFQDCLQSRMTKRIEGLNHREYEPRVLKELFNV